MICITYHGHFIKRNLLWQENQRGVGLYLGTNMYRHVCFLGIKLCVSICVHTHKSNSVTMSLQGKARKDSWLSTIQMSTAELCHSMFPYSQW